MSRAHHSAESPRRSGRTHADFPHPQDIDSSNPQDLGSPAELEFTVQARPDGHVIQARILGPINRESTRVLQIRLDKLVADRVTAVGLQLGDVAYLDSDGVRWLQRIQADLSRRDIQLRLQVPPGSPVDRTLGLLGLRASFHVDYQSREDEPATRTARS